jgi:hypothetical protein
MQTYARNSNNSVGRKSNLAKDLYRYFSKESEQMINRNRKPVKQYRSPGK